MCHVHLVRAVLRNVAKKYHKEIAGKLKFALEDENKMQELIQELESRGYSKLLIPQSVFSSAYGITGPAKLQNIRHTTTRTISLMGPTSEWPGRDHIVNSLLDR